MVPTSTAPAPVTPAVPEITGVGQHTQGVLVYFDIQYADPGNNAEGFGFVGVNASWTMWDWGKRKNTLRERENLIGMASLKVRQVEDEVREKAVKAYREFSETRAALTLAEEMARLRKEAAGQAKQPADIFAAAKKSMDAEVDQVKADLAHRIAYVKLMALIGKP